MNAATPAKYRIVHANGLQIGGKFKTLENAQRMLAKYAKHPAYDVTGWRIEEV